MPTDSLFSLLRILRIFIGLYLVLLPLILIPSPCRSSYPTFYPFLHHLPQFSCVFMKLFSSTYCIPISLCSSGVLFLHLPSFSFSCYSLHPLFLCFLFYFISNSFPFFSLCVALTISTSTFLF